MLHPAPGPHPSPPPSPYRDEYGRHVGRQRRVTRLLHPLHVNRVPLLLLQHKGTVELQLQAVVRAKLDVLTLRQVAATQPQDSTWR